LVVPSETRVCSTPDILDNGLRRSDLYMPPLASAETEVSLVARLPADLHSRVAAIRQQILEFDRIRTLVDVDLGGWIIPVGVEGPVLEVMENPEGYRRLDDPQSHGHRGW
jgi:hypothetical protein